MLEMDRRIDQVRQERQTEQVRWSQPIETHPELASTTRASKYALLVSGRCTTRAVITRQLPMSGDRLQEKFKTMQENKSCLHTGRTAAPCFFVLHWGQPLRTLHDDCLAHDSQCHSRTPGIRRWHAQGIACQLSTLRLYTDMGCWSHLTYRQMPSGGVTRLGKFLSTTHQCRAVLHLQK